MCNSSRAVSHPGRQTANPPAGPADCPARGFSEPPFPGEVDCPVFCHQGPVAKGTCLSRATPLLEGEDRRCGWSPTTRLPRNLVLDVEVAPRPQALFLFPPALGTILMGRASFVFREPKFPQGRALQQRDQPMRITGEGGHVQPLTPSLDEPDLVDMAKIHSLGFLSFILKKFYLFERQRENKRTSYFICWFPSQMTKTTGADARQSQKPGPPSRSSAWPDS